MPDLQIHRRGRTLIVYLPPGYHESNARYPVLYMQDGQNLFDPATAFAGRDWQVGQTADALIHAGAIEPLIIVGIYHAGERRIWEFTHPARYADLLVRVWKPFIDRTYRTDGTAAFGGSSLGGLVTLSAGLLYPQVFRKLAALSPSVWWNDRAIVKSVHVYRSPLRARLWLDSGTAESEHPDKVMEDLRALREALTARKWPELHYAEIEGAPHSEQAWGSRFGDVLRYLFPPTSRSTGNRRRSPERPRLPGSPPRRIS